jgi:hypothetical protein
MPGTGSCPGDGAAWRHSSTAGPWCRQRAREPLTAEIASSRFPVRLPASQKVRTRHGIWLTDSDHPQLGAAGLGMDWQPRETRHSFISIGSEHGASIEDLADMAGHANPNVTRAVYRHMISDTVTRAPAALDQALAAGGEHDPLAPS